MAERAELLAPAGNFECLEAAIYFGADAVYMAGKRFGLRAFADNFSDEELKAAVSYAHARGRRIYVTVNALFRPEELTGLEDYLRMLAEIGADAVIVSDPGVFTTAKKCGLEVHISTQVSTMNHMSAGFWHEAGAKRVVLAREASLGDIRYIRANTPDTLELEAFVHGAMCVAYSGRCLLSSAFTGRSGNRGECAQPCRWEYTIHEKGYPEDYLPIGEDEKGTYILNSKDLNMIAHIPEMIEAGISSLKIEGRMKSAYYVASVTNAYRRALDAYYAGEPFDPALETELNMSGSRRFTTGFYYGRTQDAQDIKKELQDRCYTFCAMVIGKRDARGMLPVEQRNRFFAGERLHVLSPKHPFCSFTVHEIIDAEGQSISNAPHPQQHVYIDCPFELCEGDLLRAERGQEEKAEVECECRI